MGLYAGLGDGYPLMYELEYKLPVDHDVIQPRLEALDYTDDDVVHQRDTYFDAPHRNFAATDEALRVRVETRGETTEQRVTYKGPPLETTAKTREERETVVGDGAEVTAILERLGFEPAATVEKHRHRYRVGEFTVTLDSVTDLGEYLEVEGQAESDADLDALEDRVGELLGKLGVSSADHISTSYLGLVLAQRED